MQNVNFPSRYNQVMPYMIVNDAAGLIRFAQEVFGATVQEQHMRDEHVVQHAEVKIGDSVIMFADAVEGYPAYASGLFIYVTDADATYKKALEMGATSVMPVSGQSYGRSGGVKDPSGNTWWITTDTSKA